MATFLRKKAEKTIMTNLIDRWVELAHYKVNQITATFTSGAMVANGLDDRWTMGDWSTLLGMIYVSTMLIPRFYEFYKWLKRQWEKWRGNKKVDTKRKN